MLTFTLEKKSHRPHTNIISYLLRRDAYVMNCFARVIKLHHFVINTYPLSEGDELCQT
jgi:hypothetical protein